MEIWLRLILITILLIGAFFIYRKLYFDKKRLDATLEGRRIRREKGSFDLEQYADDKLYCKNEKWLYQKNKGKKKIKKHIIAKDYSRGCSLTIRQRGNI